MHESAKCIVGGTNGEEYSEIYSWEFPPEVWGISRWCRRQELALRDGGVLSHPRQNDDQAVVPFRERCGGAGIAAVATPALLRRLVLWFVRWFQRNSGGFSKGHQDRVADVH